MMNEQSVNISYNKKVLVFFDLLGFKDLIEKNMDSPQLVNDILNETNLFSQQESYAYKYDSLSFSDTVIQIFDLEICLKEYEDNVKEFISRILEAINRVQVHLLLKYKVAIRGAIVLDDVYCNVEKNVIFGPALNKAATLEKKAFYPRILIDESIASKLEIEDRIETTFLNFTVDEKGIYYANPFQYVAKTPYEQKNGAMQKLKSNIIEIIQEIGLRIESEEHKKNILEKWNWLLLKLIEREVEDLKSAREILMKR